MIGVKQVVKRIIIREKLWNSEIIGISQDENKE